MKKHTFSKKLVYIFLFGCFFFTLINPNKAANTFDDCNLPAPTNAQVTKVNSYSASVVWDQVTGNAGYRVQIFEIVNDVFNPIAVQEYEQQETSRLFTNLASGRRYKIAIQAICPVSQSFNLRSGNVAILYTVIHDDIVFSQHPTNPFSSEINLSYEIAVPGIVSMGILDANGTQIIQVVNNEYKEQGTYQTKINTEGVKPGLYLLNCQRGPAVRTLKLLKLN